MTNNQFRFLSAIGAIALSFGISTPSFATPLADAPMFSTMNVPGNLALTPSVEFPTAISVANLGAYVHANTYLGYFDPAKCYTYTYEPNAASTTGGSYFQPAGKGAGESKHDCSGKWSGNFMNWISMQTIDPFRWALTGGYRNIDLTDLTILQKAFGSGQGGQGNFPLRGTTQSGTNKVASADLQKVVPTGWASFTGNVWAQGTKLVFTSSLKPDASKAVDYGSAENLADYFVQIRVKVCDSSTTAGGVEDNCVKYGNNYKPEGLMQKYSNKIRYSAFGYLTQGGNVRQGGVLRAKMDFIGPTKPVPMSTTPDVNSSAEWDATTGVMRSNPDNSLTAATNLAFGSSIVRSGAMNYLNEFGNSTKNYMTYDNVSELYYAATRYFQNLGNVPEWSNNAQAYLDGFPVATTWTDPILYSCQKNFILGIGDSNTHYDTNVGGSTLSQGGRAKPSAVIADTLNKSSSWTNLVEQAEGLTSRGGWWSGAGTGYSTGLMAGLAYGNHVKDMRPAMDGIQTISTYWMDVMENQKAIDRNPYWLAAKYGGYAVPAGNDFDPANPAVKPVLTDAMWTSGEIINMNGTNEKRPNNYFLANNAVQMVAGLTKAFNDIAASVNAYTTAVVPSSNIMSSAGTTSYSASYGSEFWSGSVKASTLKLSSSGPENTSLWSTDSTLLDQFKLNGTVKGWDTNRVVVTWNKDHPSSAQGVPFRAANLSASMKAALDTSYVAGDDSANYLDYLRGDKSNEVATTTGLHVYRTRTSPLGDIVNSKLTLSGPPKMTYSEAYNPGYAAFKTANASRIPLVLFGANDGMLHAIDGSASTSTANGGKELFAYIPGQTFYGPDGTTTVQANSNGLAAIGNPVYDHRFFVDATPQVFDIDLKQTSASTLTTNTWKTIVVGGMGKGGKGFYAIDITDPASMGSETNVAGKVLWEISNTTTGFEHLGYSYGTPIMVKTVKYGWTLILTSGYNNDDDQGYLFLVNPANGNLLETIGTGEAAPGLTQASAFINDYTDGVADAVYVGDLNGKLWRFDLTKTTGLFDVPKVLFQTASPDGGAQPITVAPIPEIHPNTRMRTILFGTGKLLDGQDINLAKRQSFYAILDGDSKKFDTTTATTLTRASLTTVTSLTTAITLPDTSRGWYYDFGKTNNIAWRVTLTPAAAAGIVIFTTTLTSGDACNPAGKGRAYAVDYARGYSMLKDPQNPNNTVEYVDLPSSPTDNIFVNKDGTLSGIVGDSGGNLTPLQLNSPAALGVRLINWREINAVD